MDDEYQGTLKGKIQILYQLEKWEDVSRLCALYSEKYGQDVDIDMIRFKSDRRLLAARAAEVSKPPATVPPGAAAKVIQPTKDSDDADEEDAPLLLIDDHDAVQSPDMLILDEISAADQPTTEANLDYEPFPQVNELVITEPFAADEPPLEFPLTKKPAEVREPQIVDPTTENEPELSLDYNEPPPASNNLITNEAVVVGKTEETQALHESDAGTAELVMSDPLADFEPVFSMPGTPPPVIIEESTRAENADMPPETRDEEMAFADDPSVEFPDAKNPFAMTAESALAFDVEPTLTPEPEAQPAIRPSGETDQGSWGEAHVRKPSASDIPAFDWRDVPETARGEDAREKSRTADSASTIYLPQPESRAKIGLNFKTVLLIVLTLAAAVLLWLGLSGKLGLGGGAVEEVDPVPPPVRRRPAVPKPVRETAPVTPAAQADESEKLVSEKIVRAESFLKKGDLLNALAVVLEAKKIKATEPLLQLEAAITTRIREEESRAAEQKQAVDDLVQSEDQAYAKAASENTMEAWQNFLSKYPQGRFGARARNKIMTLEKAAAQKVEREFQLKIRQAQKVALRSDYVSVSQAEVNAALQQFGKPAVQFEKLEHGGEKVIVDFNSGLMWTLWSKPMVFDKAKWWANRIYAGYSGWRLPTIEESLALLRMEPALYAGLRDFAVWTGDGVSDQVRSVWVLRLPQGQHVAQDHEQLCYVWAVRNAGR